MPALFGIEDILHCNEAVSIANGSSIAFWLRQVYESSRGFELGTFDSSILATTMKIQSKKVDEYRTRLY